MSNTPHNLGPNADEVRRYIESVKDAFGFDRLGEPDERDSDVRRIREWNELSETLGYPLEIAMDGRSFFACSDDHPDAAFLKFLRLVNRIDTENSRIAEEHGLARAVELAVNAACSRCPFYDEDYFEYVGLIPEDFDEDWDFTLQAHCAFIATELVVAHLTSIQLFREMWYWYMRGHFPCGWDGVWPEGKLIVF